MNYESLREVEVCLDYEYKSSSIHTLITHAKLCCSIPEGPCRKLNLCVCVVSRSLELKHSNYNLQINFICQELNQTRGSWSVYTKFFSK